MEEETALWDIIGATRKHARQVLIRKGSGKGARVRQASPRRRLLSKAELVTDVFARCLDGEDAPRREREASLRRNVASGDQRRGQLVTHVQVALDDRLDVGVVRPGAVIVAVEAKDGTEDAVGGPAQQVAAGGTVVAAAVRMYVRFEIVHACVDHRLD